MPRRMSGNLHESLSSNRAVPTASDRSFGIVFCVVFGLIAGYQVYAGRYEVALGLAAVSAVFLLVALLRPGLLAPLNRLWTKFGLLLHRIVNPLVMGLMYFVGFTPMGVVMRLFGFDPLRNRIDRSAESYWITREAKSPHPETMTKQF